MALSGGPVAGPQSWSSVWQQHQRNVFARLKNLFGDEQMSALADYVQAALMLNYNKHLVG